MGLHALGSIFIALLGSLGIVIMKLDWMLDVKLDSHLTPVVHKNHSRE